MMSTPGIDMIMGIKIVNDFNGTSIISIFVQNTHIPLVFPKTNIYTFKLGVTLH